MNDLITESDGAMFDKFKKSMMVEFDMSDLGMMHYFSGIEVVEFAAEILISRKKYVQEILDRFQTKNFNFVSTPTYFGLTFFKDPEGRKVEALLTSKMHLTATRLDIMRFMSLISRYIECPNNMHLLATKRISQYL